MKETDEYKEVEAMLDQLDGFKFEEIVAELYNAKGYTAKVTRKSGDYGIDVIATKDGKKTAIQCKRNKKTIPVSNSVVQKALGSIVNPYNADQAAIVTTSERFTQNAIQQAGDSTIPCELIPREKLIAEILAYMHGAETGWNILNKQPETRPEDNLATPEEVMHEIIKKHSKNFTQTAPYQPVHDELIKTGHDSYDIDTDISRYRHKKRIKTNNGYIPVIKSPEEEQLDIDRIQASLTVTQRNRLVTIREIIVSLEKTIGKSIPIQSIIEAAETRGLNEEQTKETIEKFRRTGDIFTPRVGFVSTITL